MVSGSVEWTKPMPGLEQSRDCLIRAGVMWRKVTQALVRSRRKSAIGVKSSPVNLCELERRLVRLGAGATLLGQQGSPNSSGVGPASASQVTEQNESFACDDSQQS